jgi:hypothetical protein
MATNDVTPVAARTGPTQVDGAKVQTDANLHVAVTGATRRFHLWQQAPAWILGFSAVALGFVMVLTDYDSAGGWFAVSTAVALSVVASFRSPFSFGETAVSTAPSRPAKKKAQTPAV